MSLAESGLNGAEAGRWAYWRRVGAQLALQHSALGVVVHLRDHADGADLRLKGKMQKFDRWSFFLIRHSIFPALR